MAGGGGGGVVLILILLPLLIPLAAAAAALTVLWLLGYSVVKVLTTIFRLMCRLCGRQPAADDEAGADDHLCTVVITPDTSDPEKICLSLKITTTSAEGQDGDSPPQDQLGGGSTAAAPSSPPTAAAVADKSAPNMQPAIQLTASSPTGTSASLPAQQAAASPSADSPAGQLAGAQSAASIAAGRAAAMRAAAWLPPTVQGSADPGACSNPEDADLPGGIPDSPRTAIRKRFGYYRP